MSALGKRAARPAGRSVRWSDRTGRNRLPSDVWCGVAIYLTREVADAAMDNPVSLMPFLAQSSESWHAMLLPIAHRGECNYLHPDDPGLLFEVASSDPGGPLVVMTTAGFRMGPELDMARVIDFRRSVDRVRPQVIAAPGNVAMQRFTPHTSGDDGATLTV